MKTKRTISIMLSFILTVSMCLTLQTSSVDAEEEVSTDFYKKCSKLVRDNWSDDFKKETKASSAETEFQTKRLIIKTKDSNLDISKYDAKDVVKSNDNIIVLQFDTIEKIKFAYDELKLNKLVEYVEIDKVVKLDYKVEENKSKSSSNVEHNSWGIERLEINQYSKYIAKRGKNKDFVVAVVDTGVDYNHPYLSGRVLKGYDFVNGDSNPYDDNFHGTHVSGTIVDCTQELNKIKILPVKVLDSDAWGSLLDIGNGIKYATSKKANVINLSLCGDHSSYVDDAINTAISKNIVVVVAAGNYNLDTAEFCPAHISKAIIVSATDYDDVKVDFSNYGKSIDISAPGDYIYSCIPDNSYGYASGTSMSAPHISAIVAMYKLENPSFSVAQIESLVKTNVKDLGSKGWDKYYGSGQPKLTKAMYKKTLTKDINRYDIGSGNYLTYINNKGYSQYSYLNTSGKYAFTPSSWMKAAGLTVTMPTYLNGYTMNINNPYINKSKEATNLLNKIKIDNISTEEIKLELNKIKAMKANNDEILESASNYSNKAMIKKTLTKDIYRYDAGKGNYLTYINGKGYSQYSYLNASGKYAFTPSSWMSVSGLTVTMPTSSNGYVMKITNSHKIKYESTVKQIESYL